MILQEQIQILKDNKEKDIKFIEKFVKKYDSLLKNKKTTDPQLIKKIKISLYKIIYDGLINIEENPKN